MLTSFYIKPSIYDWGYKYYELIKESEVSWVYKT